MGFFQKIKDMLGLGGKAPIDDEKQQKIVGITKDSVENWKPEYEAAYDGIIKEWTEQNLDFTHPKVDKEAKKRANADTLKENIKGEVSNELMDDISKDFPEDPRAKMMAEKAAEKAIEKIVDKTVDEAIDKIASSKAEKKE